MTDTNKTNEVTDQEFVLRVSILLTKNIRIVSGLMIFAFFAMIISWQQNAPEYGWWVSGLACYVLGAILGYRAHQLNVSRPIGAAFGVAWRIGPVCAVLAVLAEYATPPNQMAIVTVDRFPFLFFSFIGAIWSTFLLAYLAGAIRSGLACMSAQNLITTILAFAGLAAQIYFGMSSNVGEDMRRNGEGERLEEEQSEQIKLLQGQIKLLQEQIKKDDARGEPTATDESAAVLPNGM